MISISSITLQRGNKVLLQDASLSCYAQQKIGVVGKNGCGKTSLFALLQEKLIPEHGEISLPNKINLVTVEQEIPESTRLALDYVIDADIELRRLEQELQQAEQSNNGNKIAQIYEILQHQDGFTATARASKILLGLGFDEEQLQNTVNSLSGGWRMRLNLARALFIPSDILLLDEPTNHLDLDAVIWLEKWLQKYTGLLLLISHDREFLDQIVTHIAHLEHKNINLYKGNYSNFESQRAEQIELQSKQYLKQQQHIAHMQEFIERFRYKATKAKQAQSRIKALEKLEKILPAQLDSPFTFSFKPSNNLSNPLINCSHISFAYEENKFILRNVKFSINAGDRIGLLGRNGAGKSTFIKLLAQNLQPSSGEIIVHKKLKIGYFTQNTLDTLDEEKTALDHLKHLANSYSITELDLRKFLGSFAFSDDSVLMPVKYFSGGEKARLALALLIWQAPNILLLDEPTNHLDMDMRQALAMAIQTYDGAVITVSHDRFLLEQIVDDYYLVNKKNVTNFTGDLHEYESWLLNDIKETQKTSDIQKDFNQLNQRVNQINSSEKKQKPKKNLFLLTKIEKEINDLNIELSKLDEQQISLSMNIPIDIKELNNIKAKKNKIIEELSKKENEWFVFA